MNWYARSAMAMLLGAFGLIAIGVGLDGLYPLKSWGPGGGPGNALPEQIPPIVVIVLGVAALVIAQFMLRKPDDDE